MSVSHVPPPVSEEDQLPVSPVCSQPPTVDDQPDDTPPPVSEEDQLPVSPVCCQPPTVDDQSAATAMSHVSLDVAQQADGSYIITLPENVAANVPVVVNLRPANNLTMQSVDLQDGSLDDTQQYETNDSPINDDAAGSDSAVKLRSRKRVRRCDTWKKNIRKMKRTMGEKYTSDTTNKEVREKSVQPINCSKCRLKCSDKISAEQRQMIFQEFYRLSTWEAQTTYITQSIMQFEPRRRTVPSNSDAGSRKTKSRAYYLTVSDESGSHTVRVCKEMFLKTLDINTARVHYCLTKKKDCRGDARGSKNKPKTPADLTDYVKTHIGQFPKFISHYSRHRSSKEYLRDVNSISDMYRLYVEQCRESGLQTVSEWVYRKIFNCDFNLSFHSPSSDTCKKCDMYAVQKEIGDQEGLRQEWDHHLALAESTRAMLNYERDMAKGKPGMVFAFDLQKTKALPYLSTSEAYYKRQLSVYNLGIHDCGTGEGFFNFWHEATASRGPAEIASCIWHWLCQNRDKGVRPERLVAFSDACGGQNRNFIMAVFWMHVTQEMTVDSIDHIFMVSGHSFLPCDEDFGLDEKQKHKTEAVYSLSQWMSVAQRARKKPFAVTEMAAESFLRIKDLCRDVVNRKKNETGEKVDWLRLRWMRFRKDRANQMFYKYSVDDNEFMVVNFGKRGRGRPQHTQINKLQCLYPEGRAISAAKYKDITDLLKYVPPVFHDFYSELPHERRQNSGPEGADDIFERDSEGISDTEL